MSSVQSLLIEEVVPGDDIVERDERTGRITSRVHVETAERSPGSCRYGVHINGRACYDKGTHVLVVV